MESKIIPLKGLKVEAVAVEIPNGYRRHELLSDSILFFTIGSIAFGEIESYHGSVKLPEGSWSILERANELDLSDIVNLLYGKDYLFADEPIHTPIIQEWQSYCTANNLTNQLILIKNG